jgi:hypothetical protein
MTEATCTRCGETKDASEFYRDGRTTSGLGSWCKACMAVGAKARMRRQRGVRHASTLFDEVCRDLLPADLYASVLAEAERRQREYGGVR